MPTVIVANNRFASGVKSRTRKGVTQYRMCCDRCGLVRWFEHGALGTPHCLRGIFLYHIPDRRNA